jgi:uncharacterized membrane protein
MRRHHEILRVEALSDAVFAFAATLLVVSLEVPHTYPELVDNLRGFVAFGISFLMLLTIWWAHNGFFRRYGMQDGKTMVLNSVLLFVVLFYVYPLKFLFSALVGQMLGIQSESSVELHAGEATPLMVIYGLGFIAVFLCFSLLYLHAWNRRTELGLSALEAFEAITGSRHYLIFAGVGVLSIVLALLHVGERIGMPGWIYGMIGPLCTWNGMARRRQQQQQLESDPALSGTVSKTAAAGG